MNEISPDGRVIVAVVFVRILTGPIGDLDLIRVARKGNVYMHGAQLFLVREEAIAQCRSQLLTDLVVVIVHGVGTDATVHTESVGFSIYRICFLPEETGASDGVTRCKHRPNRNVTECYRRILIVERINDEIDRMRILIEDQSLFRNLLVEVPVFLRHVHLGTGQLLHDLGSTTVIEVGMAEQDLLDVGWLVAGFVDAVDELINALWDCGIDQDAAFARFDEPAADSGLTCDIPGSR